jgi:hypothetical protein
MTKLILSCYFPHRLTLRMRPFECDWGLSRDVKYPYKGTNKDWSPLPRDG